MKISFVILTWNSQDYIEKCLLSYTRSLTSENVSAEFLVVDNGSKDKTAEILEKLFKSLPDNLSGKIFKLKNNLGTTRSRNIALKQAKGEFIVVCDSDTEFLEGKWQDMFELFDLNSNLGLVAPQLINDDGKIQQSVKRFPTLINKVGRVFKIFLKKELAKDDLYEDFFEWKQLEKVETAISAFWIFPKHLLNKIGYLDEKIFYAPEDLDFCVRIFKNNLEIIYDPFFKVLHKDQRISHKKPISFVSFSHFLCLFYYFLKHKYYFSRKKLYAGKNKI